ncbi:juvenile hormone epoxide hydrolase 1-like isoform X2 [Arctopsyche grandis]
MGKCCKFFVYGAALLAAWIGYKTHNALYDIPPVPKLALDQWWGPGQPPKTADTSIRPFKVEFKREMLEDLRDRLSNARYHDQLLEGIGFQYGFHNNFLKSVVNFWKNGYPYIERLNYLNQFPQFKTNIQGLDIHYLHVKPTQNKDNLKVFPMMLLHGWPGSVVEFYKAIPMLTTPRKGMNFVFEIIIPSLPGYGFSQAASKPGLGAAQMSVVMKNLMGRLGYEKYMVQGGDWGSLIAHNMAVLFPENILMLHTNMPAVMTPKSSLKHFLGSFYPSLFIDKNREHLVYPVSDVFQGLLEETGYMHIQATKPDTVGVGLSDSPIGLTAYILEKFSTWTKKEWKQLPDGGLTNKYSLTELLDNVMIYWISNSITTSMRLYSESFNKAHYALKLDSIPITVPTAVCRCPNDLIYVMDTQLTEKYYNLIHIADYDDCGHFAIFEEPVKIVKDIFMAVSKYVELNKSESGKSEL